MLKQALAASMATGIANSGGLALHLRLDRAAQGRDAEPRQPVARRDQRRALSGPDRAATARSRVLPLAFDYGQNQLLSTWAAGGYVIAFDYLLPRDVVRAVGRHDVTVLAGVPPLWIQLAEADWSAARAAAFAP